MVKAKDKALQAMLQEGDVPLRDGVTKLIDDALAANVKFAMLCGTASTQVHTFALFDCTNYRKSCLKHRDCKRCRIRSAGSGHCGV